MSEKKFTSRIIHKHDTETNWLKSSLVPLQGELIVYDIENGVSSYERLKIGDGVQNVNTLPFVDDTLRTELLGEINSAVSGLATEEYVFSVVESVKAAASDQDAVVLAEAQRNIDAVSVLVGDTTVSEQISSAINEATADDFGIYVQAQEPTDAVAGDIWIDTANDPSYIPPTLPEITEADNGKVPMVVNGKLQLVSINLSMDANGVLSI